MSSSPAHTPIQQNLKWSSAKYGATFTQGKLGLPPAKKYLVLTCMDARIDPAQAFGIELGDAHVIRNVSKLLNCRSTSAGRDTSPFQLILTLLTFV